jgi:hypothetical protein
MTYAFTFQSTPNTLKFELTFTETASAKLAVWETINGYKYPISYTYDSHGIGQNEKIVSGTTNLFIVFFRSR